MGIARFYKYICLCIYYVKNYLKYLYYATFSISFKVLLESKCFDLNADLCHEHQVFNLVLFFLINEHHDMFIIVTFGDDDE